MTVESFQYTLYTHVYAWNKHLCGNKEITNGCPMYPHPCALLLVFSTLAPLQTPCMQDNYIYLQIFFSTDQGIVLPGHLSGYCPVVLDPLGYTTFVVVGPATMWGPTDSYVQSVSCLTRLRWLLSWKWVIRVVQTLHTPARTIINFGQHLCN